MVVNHEPNRKPQVYQMLDTFASGRCYICAKVAVALQRAAVVKITCTRVHVLVADVGETCSIERSTTIWK